MEELERLPIPLLEWYHENARVLPWRSDPTPYHVLVSEIMLQQTRVTAVLDYYRRFLEALPTAACLAAVEEDRLLKLCSAWATTTGPGTSRKPPGRWWRTTAGTSPGPMRGC